MRLLYLHQYFNTPSMSGGTRSYEMARRLAAWGHDVQLVTSDRDGRFPADGEWHETEEAGIRVHWTPLPYSNRMSYGRRMGAFFAFSLRAARKAAALGGDLVFATSTPLTIALPGAYASRRLGVPMVFEVRDLWPELPAAVGALRNPLAVVAARRLERFAYRSSARIVALSPGMRDGVVRAGYPEDRVAVIPNSCDVDLFAPDPAGAARLRALHPWLGDRPLVLYTGTFGSINGVPWLARLAAEVRRIDPEIRFLALGDGKERDLVEGTARDLGVLGETFFVMGPVPKREIPAWYSCASVGTSLFVDLKEMWNNSANKFFDTLAAGRPAVINYGGWQADLLEETGAGIVLGPGNLQEAAAVLCSRLTDRAWMERAGAAAASLARERFDRDRLARALEGVLLGALGEKIRRMR